MIAYNADSGNLMGMLYHYPASKHSDADADADQGDTKKAMRKVWNWDTAVYLGEIPEAKETFNVVGNTNEYGLVIAETTFGGIEALANPQNQPEAKIDYGSLIYITLQRAKTAKEAIHTMANLLDTYGYASEGESFSIADRHGDVWIMEVIGRGKGKVGAVWVARKVPDGMISGHSNQARITVFPRDDADNCLYSHDVIDLAKEIGIYKTPPDDPNDLKFSFSDVYDPVGFMGARASDARTWAIFSALSEDDSFEKTYEAYAMGKDNKNRMPLWIKPKKLLSLDDIRNVMGNHYEGTALANGDDVGAGMYGTPYRPRPLTWSYDKKSYHNERSVATQQTGWNFIAQIRSDMPAPISSVLWFAVDDSSTSPRFPVYGCSTSVSDAYSGKGTQDGVPSPLLTFDLTKAFWVQNMVSNLVYSRWSQAYPLVLEKLQVIHDGFQEELDFLDEQLLALYDSGESKEMLRVATEFSVGGGDRLHKEWMDFYGSIFARLRDYFVIEEDPSDPICNCKVNEGGIPDTWKKRIVDETGSKYECIDDDSVPDLAAVSLKRLRGSTHEKFSMKYFAYAY
jgi:dipeptidase